MTVDEIAKAIGNAPLPVIADGLLGVLNPQWKALASKEPQSDGELRQMVGARIRIMRQFLGLTQAELAARTGTTKATIASYETGRRAASYRNLIALSRTLRVSTDWLLGAEPPQEQ